MTNMRKKNHLPLFRDDLSTFDDFFQSTMPLDLYRTTFRFDQGMDDTPHTLMDSSIREQLSASRSVRLYPMDQGVDAVVVRGKAKGQVRKAYVETRQTTKGLPWTTEILVLETK